MSPDPRILIGYDATDPARHALRWAVREALERRWPLVVAMADDVSRYAALDAEVGLAPAAVALGGEEDHLRELVERLRAENPGLDVSHRLVIGGGGGFLVEESARPGLVVIGTRGLGGIKAALLGGVADAVVTHAKGPVVVVPAGEPVDGPVVVGVDDSAGARAALRYALAEGERRDVEVVAVTTWLPMAAVPMSPMTVLPAPTDELEQAVRAEQERVLQEVCAQVPGARVTSRVVAGSPSQVLVDESARASLVVVGSRGRGGFTGLLLGSTSRETLQHTRCPAVVVPHLAG